MAYRRRSKIDAAKHAGAILKRLVQRLRAVWPEVKITFRGDSGCCRRRVLAGCERRGVDYRVGLAKTKTGRTLVAGGRKTVGGYFGTAAGVRRNRLCGRHLAAASAGDRQGRTQRKG